MPYKIISQIHLLPPHQRDFFAGASVTRMIGKHNIIELGEVAVEGPFLVQHCDLLARLTGRGEVMVVDEKGRNVQIKFPEIVESAPRPAESTAEPIQEPQERAEPPEPVEDPAEPTGDEKLAESPSPLPRRKKKGRHR